MKILRLTCCMFVLLLLLVALAFSTSASRARAAPATVAKFKFSGPAAFAPFDNVVGCVETTVFVDGSTTNNSPEADVFIGQFDNCTGMTLLDASGSTFTPDFQIAANLAEASLSATISVFDQVSGNTFNVSVSQTWTATGRLSIESDSLHFHTKGFTITGYFINKFRNATASGTVLYGTTNLTPSPSVSAQTANSTLAEVVITQP
jgi:hypothetical protein